MAGKGEDNPRSVFESQISFSYCTRGTDRVIPSVKRRDRGLGHNPFDSMARVYIVIRTMRYQVYRLKYIIWSNIYFFTLLFFIHNLLHFQRDTRSLRI